jgi:hypothetical protein
MQPTPLWRICIVCRARTRHDADVCENDPRHPDYTARSERQIQAFPQHTDAARLWCDPRCRT